jgi:hypothetical protein
MHRTARESVIVTLGLLIAAIALFASTFTQSFTATEVAQSPMFFPRIILMLWIGLNIVALFQILRTEMTTSPVASWMRIGIVMVISLIYTNIIGSEGFFLPSVAFALVCLPAFGIRKVFPVALFAFAVPGALVLLFNHVLGMPLPTSRFTYLF